MEVYVHLSSDVWLVQLSVDLAPSTPCTTSHLEDSLSYHLAEVLIAETLKLRLTLFRASRNKRSKLLPRGYHCSSPPPYTMGSSSFKSVSTMHPLVYSIGVVGECPKPQIDSHHHKVPALCDDGEHRGIHSRQVGG